MRAQRLSDFSRIVKNTRLDRGYNQEQLACRIGITRQRVARLENGEGDPSLGTVLRILAALNLRVSVSDAESTVANSNAPEDSLTAAVPRLDVSGLSESISRALESFDAERTVSDAVSRSLAWRDAGKINESLPTLVSDAGKNAMRQYESLPGDTRLLTSEAAIEDESSGEKLKDGS